MPLHIFLDAPVQRVGDEHLAARADGDVVRLAVFAERLALPRALHGAEHISLKVERHHLPGVTVRQPDRLVRRHEQSAWRARMLRLADVIAVGEIVGEFVGEGGLQELPQGRQLLDLRFEIWNLRSQNQARLKAQDPRPKPKIPKPKT